MYTGSSALIEALVDAGVSYLFVNFGSDHPGIVEALAHALPGGIQQLRQVLMGL